MSDGEFVVLDTSAFDRAIAKKQTLINSYNAINEEYDRIVSNLLTNWKGRGATAFQKDALTVRTNIVGIFDILKTMCDTLTDCREIFAECDKALGTFNCEPDSSEAGMTGVSQDTSSVPSNDHDIVTAYERENPDVAKKMDKAFKNSGLADSDIDKIKSTVYNAPEPYRSLYIQNLGKYTYGEGNRTAYSEIFNRAMYSDADELSKDPKGAYNGIFHESGHAIDDVEKSWGNITEKYSYKGRSLYELITQDVRGNISAYIDANYGDLSVEEKNIIMRSMNLTDDAEFRYMARDNALSDGRLNRIRTQVLDHYYDVEMAGYDNEAVCDIYGGVTNEVFYKEHDEVHLSHVRNGSDYWFNNGLIDLGYFAGNYDYATGEFIYGVNDQSGNQAKELWAIFFAAQMTQDTAVLKNMKEHFPSAYEAMEQMALDMCVN